MSAPEPTDERPTMPAILHGLRGRCPSCGDGRLFGRFLKVNPSCPRCGERLDLHQADDLPAYLVILLLGHIIVPLMIEVNAGLAIPLIWQAAIWPALAGVLALAAIQPVKGGVIALQWSRRMANFT